MEPNSLRLAIASGIVLGAMGAVATVMALVGMPGFRPFADAPVLGYGPWGYSVSWPGVAVAALWGFLEGFVWRGALALVYNWLVRRTS